MKHLLSGLPVLATTALSTSIAIGLAMPSVAYAQVVEEEAQPAVPAAEADAGDGNEIVVTATKREQTLQEIPVAVSVTTANTIERAQIRDLRDLASVVPSLRVTERQNSVNTNFIIRGFGNGANNAGIEPSVGVFIDGVYRSRSASQIADLPDIQRVEVLRGPQSTLFGKNASAGVISITTQKPKFTFGGNVEASYGSYNALVLKGMVTGPLSENIAASVAAGYNRRDGYNKDLGTGNRTNNRNRWFLKGQMLWNASDSTEVRLMADYGKIDEICCGVVNVSRGIAPGLTSNPTNALIALGAKVNDPADRFANVVNSNIDSTNRIENYGFSAQIEHQAGPLTLTSITANRSLGVTTNQDSDFTSGDLLGRNYQDVKINTFTQEFRVSANFVDRVNALLGIFYFNEKIKQANEVKWGTMARPYANLLAMSQSNCALSIVTTPGCPFPVPGNAAGLPVPTSLETTFGALESNPAKYAGQFFAPNTGLDERYRLNDESFSIFSQIDFKITDRLTLTGGVNYTRDKKNYSENVVSNDVFAGINFNAPAYTPLRNSLLRNGAIAQQVGTALGLGRSASASEIAAFASGTSAAGAAGAAAFPTITAGAAAFATANQNCVVVGTPAGCTAGNPLNPFTAFQFFPPFLNLPNSVEDGKLSDDNFSYTARLAYELSDHMNVYVSFSTGYKPPSVNLSRDSRPAASSAAALTAAGLTVVNQTYGGRFATAEKSTVYEAGFKGSWGIGSLNLAIFKQDIKGFQSNIFTGSGFFLGNAGKQSTFGVEVEGVVKPFKGLALGVAMTFLDPKYDDFVNSAFGNATGIRPSDVPAFSGTFSADYTHELANDNRLILHADFSHQSKVQVVEGLPNYITKNSATGAVVNYQTGLDAAKPFTREVNEMNASLTYAMSKGLEFTIWGRNITNNRYISTIFDSPAQQGSVSAYTNTPRTWGGSVRYRF